MNSKQYLEKCKQKLGIKSNYELAKALDIREVYVGRYCSGKSCADCYTCFKIAEVLELEPSIVIADIKAESAKNPNEKSYFKAFLDSCMKAVAGLLIITALMNSTKDETAFAV